MIGGGAGSGYPKEAAEALTASRKKKLQGDQAEKWKRFVELRRPETLRGWAEAAGLTDFHLAGKGAIAADDPKVGQGVLLWFTKGKPTPASEEPDPEHKHRSAKKR